MIDFAARAIPQDLRDRYLAEGWWTDDTLGAMVERRLGATPETAVRVWSEERPWSGTYADIEAEARRLVTVLREAGIEPGDVVAFQLPNWREAIVSFYGLALGGYVLVPIVHIYGRKEVGFILRQSGARAYISAPEYGHVDFNAIVDDEAAALPDLRLHLVASEGNIDLQPVGIDRRGWDSLEHVAPSGTATSMSPDDVAVLAYTSGTTSDPKGVVHSHRTLLAELTHMAAFKLRGQPNLMGSPVTHATGMLGAVLSPIQEGEPINVIDRWDPDRVLDIIIEADISAGNGASIFLASLMNHPGFTAEHAARMPRIGLGGAPVPRALGEQAANHGIAIIRAYGSTEHPSISGGMWEDSADKRHGTDGRALEGVELRLLDEDGAAVGPGLAGEILSRGPELCVGYTDPELTAATFDADGWYRTGDMGVLDADGFLTITDRVKDVIIRGGENVSAAEVEEAVNQLAEVIEVAVVAAPDERLGEHACALVRLAPGTEELSMERLQDHLEVVGFARQKWPEELRVVADFPRTATGKIRKVDIRRQLREEAT